MEEAGQPGVRRPRSAGMLLKPQGKKGEEFVSDNSPCGNSAPCSKELKTCSRTFCQLYPMVSKEVPSSPVGGVLLSGAAHRL